MEHLQSRRRKFTLPVRMAALLMAVCCLFGGCQVQPGETEPEETKQSEETIVKSGIIKDVYVDKARYAPGEKAVLTVELEAAESAVEAQLQVRVTHLTEKVYEASAEVSLEAGQADQQTVALELPQTDFTGYSVEVYLVQDEKNIDWEMTAVDVSSDWSKFPRYAYLTKYGEQSDEQIRATLERLNKHHITGLFYYDVTDRHEQPLAGTVEDPASGWKTLANHYASRNTVQKLIDYGHEYNMNSYLYNLIFGAYEGYSDVGVNWEWGLYRNKDGTGQDYHGDFVDSWETKRLYLFDPANTGWQDYYLGVTEDVLQVYNYDGIQVDSLGYRGKRYDYYGNEVNLAYAYTTLLNRMTDELDTKIIFNPVSGYGLPEMLSNVDYDIVYEEVWPGECASYTDLKNAVDYCRNRMNDEKGIVISAYMNYKKSDGTFNTAGVLLTNATLMASGAGHLELGDTGMLKSEYYPGDTLRINDTLAAALRNYYSFSVAYENYLRDPDYTDVVLRTTVNDRFAAMDSTAGKIWCFTKKNADLDQVVNFINLIGVSDTDWVDNYGKKETPETQTDLVVKQYVDAIPAHVYLASPDQNEGIMTELEFEVGQDVSGYYITFTMPELKYWNMVVIKLS